MFNLQVRAQQPPQDRLWDVRHRLSDLNKEVQRPKQEGEEVEHRT